MRILFLSPRQSLPARSGARLREYHFLRALGRTAEVTYLYFRDPAEEAIAAADLPFCREAVGVPKPAAYGIGKNVRGLVGRWPLPILNYTSAAMSAAVEKAMAGRAFDIVHLDSIHMIRYAKQKPIYNWHNIESEAMRRFSSTTASRARSLYAALTVSKLERVEREILESAFGHIVCSERERAQLAGIAPGARIEVVENGVDTGYFSGLGDGAEGSRKVVFVGAMDYFPNSEAAVFFANQIWPHVRERMAGAELTIVGANPGPGVRALGDLPGVKVTGMVPDLRPYYRDALAAVVPLRTGGGTRLKILEAMAAGVPVVSTPLGAEGLGVSDGEHALLVEAGDGEGWAAALVGLAERPERRRQLTEEGLRLVKGRYDWEILGEKLRSVYEGWLA